MRRALVAALTTTAAVMAPLAFASPSVAAERTITAEGEAEPAADGPSWSANDATFEFPEDGGQVTGEVSLKWPLSGCGFLQTADSFLLDGSYDAATGRMSGSGLGNARLDGEAGCDLANPPACVGLLCPDGIEDVTWQASLTGRELKGTIEWPSGKLPFAATVTTPGFPSATRASSTATGRASKGDREAASDGSAASGATSGADDLPLDVPLLLGVGLIMTFLGGGAMFAPRLIKGLNRRGSAEQILVAEAAVGNPDAAVLGSGPLPATSEPLSPEAAAARSIIEDSLDLPPTHAIPEGGLHVMTEPDASSESTGWLGGGNDVRVVEWRGQWARVETKSGAQGWVEASRLVARG